MKNENQLKTIDRREYTINMSRDELKMEYILQRELAAKRSMSDSIKTFIVGAASMVETVSKKLPDRFNMEGFSREFYSNDCEKFDEPIRKLLDKYDNFENVTSPEIAIVQKFFECGFYFYMGKQMGQLTASGQIPNNANGNQFQTAVDAVRNNPALLSQQMSNGQFQQNNQFQNQMNNGQFQQSQMNNQMNQMNHMNYAPQYNPNQFQVPSGSNSQISPMNGLSNQSMSNQSMNGLPLQQAYSGSGMNITGGVNTLHMPNQPGLSGLNGPGTNLSMFNNIQQKSMTGPSDDILGQLGLNNNNNPVPPSRTDFLNLTEPQNKLRDFPDNLSQSSTDSNIRISVHKTKKKERAIQL
jgi:hypothetical protein